MEFKKGELKAASNFIEEHLERIIDWSVGDIRRCCRMKEDGTFEEGGALVGAFILWCCAIEYFGGLYTNFTNTGDTQARFRVFIQKYLRQYDWEKVEELRWSLSHYYSPHNYILYHENDRSLHLRAHNDECILIHLGCAIEDLEKAIKDYKSDLEASDILKVKLWRFYTKQPPIMPIKVTKPSPPLVLTSMATGTAIQMMQPINASGTASIEEWLNKPFQD